MNRTPEESARRLLEPLLNQDKATPFQLEIAKLLEETGLESGTLNPNWREVGVRWQNPTSSSATETPPASPSKSGAG